MSTLAVGLLLALVASVALNGAFLLQHAGAADAADIDPRHPIATLVSLLRSPLWAVGAVVGMTGWALHVAALSRAPLSLVQAFVAGGLALAAPMAAFGLRHRLQPAERTGVALMVVALLALSAGLHGEGRHAHYQPVALGVYAGVLGLGAVLLCAVKAEHRRAAALGLAGGLLYGIADLSIKALTGQHGIGSVVRSPWLVVAGAATLCAFFAFQRGLQRGRPITVIALMTAGTNVATIAGGLLVFSDPLGRTPALAILHAAAFVLVAVAAWWLAPTQASLSVPEADLAVEARSGESSRSASLAARR